MKYMQYLHFCEDAPYSASYDWNKKGYPLNRYVVFLYIRIKKVIQINSGLLI